MTIRALIPFALALASALAAPAAAAAAAAPAPEPRVAEAEALHARALRLLERDDVDARRMAIEHLERARLLAPEDPAHELALARACFRAGFLKRARGHFERVTRLAPDDAHGRFGLGQVWRRDWLKFLEPASLARAVEHLELAARLDPGHVDAWLLLTPLLVEQGKLGAAAAAASRAHDADPRRGETALAVAYTRHRRGELELAALAFERALPRLATSVRERFDDIAPVASAADTARLHRLEPAEQVAFIERFWREHDPDLASRENEARLEYWSRVAHAYFLFYDPRRREWDQRGEVFVRYGAPVRTDYNPLDRPLYFAFSTGPAYPMNTLVWEYPELGMTVVMQDRLLSERYLPPVSMFRDLDPSPHPDSLARRGDRLAVRGGRGVFPLLPPGTRPLPVRGLLSRFDGDGGPRLLAQLESPGVPGDSLWAEWVVLDSTLREVARGDRALAPSACDADARRVADFASAVAPGRYLVGMTVRGRDGARGVFRGEIAVESRAGLRLSDLVVSCGAPYVEPGERAPTVRLEPNPDSRVPAGEPLTAYFEIYGLAPGEDGRSRFEYTTTVRSAARDERIWLQRLIAPRREVPPIAARREERHDGALRRQSLSVPVHELPPGRYRLEVRVRDLVAGTDAASVAEFEREGPAGS